MAAGVVIAARNKSRSERGAEEEGDDAAAAGVGADSVWVVVDSEEKVEIDNDTRVRLSTWEAETDGVSMPLLVRLRNSPQN
jgi:hypothetical protein